MFIAYDPNADSVLFSHYLTPGHGVIKLAPDDKVFFTNPGTGPYSVYGIGPPFYEVYDPHTNNVTDSVWARGICTGVGPSPVGELVITPDERWVVGIHPGFGEILTFSLESMRQEKCYSLGNRCSLWYLTCQSIR